MKLTKEMIKILSDNEVGPRPEGGWWCNGVPVQIHYKSDTIKIDVFCFGANRARALGVLLMHLADEMEGK